MNDLRVLENLTIRDVKPTSDKQTTGRRHLLPTQQNTKNLLNNREVDDP